MKQYYLFQTSVHSLEPDFLSGVDASALSDALKRNYVDCYRQDTGDEEIPELLKGTINRIAEKIIPGQIVQAGGAKMFLL